MECRLLYLVGQLGLGGLERQLVYLIRSMDRERYKPVVVVWSNAQDDHYAQDLRALDVPVIWLGENSTRLGKLRELCALVCVVQPEVIHSYTFYTNIVAWWAARGKRAIPIGSVRSNFLLIVNKQGSCLDGFAVAGHLRRFLTVPWQNGMLNTQRRTSVLGAFMSFGTGSIWSAFPRALILNKDIS